MWHCEHIAGEESKIDNRKDWWHEEYIDWMSLKKKVIVIYFFKNYIRKDELTDRKSEWMIDWCFPGTNTTESDITLYEKIRKWMSKVKIKVH